MDGDTWRGEADTSGELPSGTVTFVLGAHLAHIFTKLGVSTRAELAARAARRT